MQKRNLLDAVFIFMLATFANAVARAEHRVALLIDNHNYQSKQLASEKKNLKSLHTGLKKYGFRCTLRKNLTADKLKATLNDFASSTPTRGTALVYFCGQVLPGSDKGKEGLHLVATDAKSGEQKNVGKSGFGINRLLQTLSTKGGSSLNLVVMDATKISITKETIPPECLLAFTDTNNLISKITGKQDLITTIKSTGSCHKSNLPKESEVSGKGDAVVSSPDKFVLGKRAGDQWVNSRGMVFCWCPPGSYISGSPKGTPGRYPDEDEKKVNITTGFWISKFELTLRENPRNRPRNTIATHKNHPVTMIHLDDGRSMTARTITSLEHKQGRLPKAWQYSLPTAEQWEYAARAGTTKRFYFGDDLNLLPQHANFADKSYYNSKDIFSTAAHRTLDDGAIKLAIVGSYKQNPWGLYDVYGNVGEWCIDNAVRGGSWVSNAKNCRSAYRDSYSSRNEQNFIGYRLIIQKTPPQKKKTKNK